VTIIRKHSLYYELKESLCLPECPICHLMLKAGDSFLDMLLHENVNDHGLRQQLAKSRGFCNLHAWQLRQKGDPLGHAILYADQLNRFLKQYTPETIQPDTRKYKVSKGLTDLLEQSIDCPLCQLLTESETRYVQSLVRFLGDPDFCNTYQNSFGVCRRHLLQLLKMKKVPGAVVDVLVNTFLKTGRGLLQELKELQRKFDYRFTHEKKGSERDAWIRVIRLWAGSQGL